MSSQHSSNQQFCIDHDISYYPTQKEIIFVINQINCINLNSQNTTSNQDHNRNILIYWLLSTNVKKIYTVLYEMTELVSVVSYRVIYLCYLTLWNEFCPKNYSWQVFWHFSAHDAFRCFYRVGIRFGSLQYWIWFSVN